MTNPQPDEIERIVANLSEAQRRCIKVMSGEYRQPPTGHAYWAGSLLSGPRLTEFRYAKPLESRRLYRLNDLGLAVRAALTNTTEGGIENRRGRRVRPHVPGQRGPLDRWPDDA